MNVTFNKTDDTCGRLTVNVEAADYKDKVTAELKKVGQHRQIPGFRKGHVPMSQLQRMFGPAVTSDVINHEVYEAVTSYLRDNKVNILGEPMPVEVKELDLKNQTDFTFEYDLILAPELNVELNKELHVPYYTIEVTDKMIDEQDEAMRKRFGAQVPGEETTPDAVVKGALMQLNADGTVNENDGAIQVVSAIVAPFTFKSKEEAEKFANKKVGDKVVFNPWNTCDGNAAELASMLNIDKAIAGDVKSDFELAISEIIVVKPAELGEEYYTNVFGKDKVTDETQYRAAIKDMIAAELANNSEMLFRRDAQKVLLEKYGNMQFADELLKKWLLRANEGATAEKIEEEYPTLLPSLKWQIITERIAEKGNLKITEEMLLNIARQAAAQQFASYGMTNLDSEIVDNYAKQMLEDKRYRNRLVERAGDIMLFGYIKEQITTDNEEVSLDKFKEIAEAE